MQDPVRIIQSKQPGSAAALLYNYNDVHHIPLTFLRPNSYSFRSQTDMPAMAVMLKRSIIIHQSTSHHHRLMEQEEWGNERDGEKRGVRSWRHHKSRAVKTGSTSQTIDCGSSVLCASNQSAHCSFCCCQNTSMQQFDQLFATRETIITAGETVKSIEKLKGRKMWNSLINKPVPLGRINTQMR
ncbi:hypothetical protein OUZ56_029501 [Daphnia magna]|uniref:Uncharacterized protein n=1 Tax=Daphnia magna TaxID=35525 RepID=A0ABR0B705_9CRUS|nr:hypothetical protein OUZ56_029501 [Daphnia magna]